MSDYCTNVITTSEMFHKSKVNMSVIYCFQVYLKPVLLLLHIATLLKLIAWGNDYNYLNITVSIEWLPFV